MAIEPHQQGGTFDQLGAWQLNHTGKQGERMNPNAEAYCTIEGWDLKHFWKRVFIQAAREAHFAVADPQSISFAVPVTAHTLELAGLSSTRTP